VMVIDLDKCIGCDRCVAVCTGDHELPAGITWRRVATAEIQTGSTKRQLFVPMSCMHCANPPCRDVCPTGATHQHDDGIVDIDHERCIGCGYCVTACPYLARSMVTKVAANTSSTGSRPLSKGVATKCDMCRSKVQTGVAHGLVPGRDAAATPSCVNSCLWGAIQFGDADDPESNVSVLLRNNRFFRLNEQLGTEPSVYYLNAEAVPPAAS